MKVVREIPGHLRDFPIGTVVTAAPSRFVARCFNITRADPPVCVVTTVPADHLEEVE